MSSKMLKAALVLSSLYTLSVQAAVIPADGEIHYNCSAVTLNYVGTPDNNDFAPGEVYNATSCKGMEGNDPNYALNIGLFGDGLLNGDTGLFDSYEFANWVDVNGDGIDDKPGWIGLARVDSDAGTIDYNEVNGIDLHPYGGFGNVFDLTFNYNNELSGDWRLQVNVAALIAAQALLGNSYFDHLNIVLKGGTTGFMSYNFNFNTIFATHNALYNDDLSLLNNYTLGGTWATTDLVKSEYKCTGPAHNQKCETKTIQQGLSHATFAAHDPLTTNDIPSPSTLGLIGLSLIGLVASRRRKA